MDGELVLGFAYEPSTPGADGDRLLLEGDENRDEPPARPIPSPRDVANGIRIDRCGLHPVAGLKQEYLSSADDIAPYLPSAVDRAISRSEVEALLPLMLSEIDDRHHTIWLVGGAVRDLLTEPEHPIKDLDFCGTIPTGEFYDLAHESLARAGSGDYERGVSMRGVVYIKPLAAGKRIVEYKALTLGGFRFLSSGGDLTEDTAGRDFTVNSLYYDLRRQLIIDPSGHGIEHLRHAPSRLVIAYQGDNPVEQASIVLRGLKFLIRWPDADASALANWAGSLPADLNERIPTGKWKLLTAVWHNGVAKKHRRRAIELAADLGPVAAALLRKLSDGPHNAA
ncbi:hypothetical protein GCM10009555_024070 [Acrocarpospora macrocephala]|uniref:Poly A polymerase head domain-containing protein n=1 Tax=Acrocarpospora macrocephala TaxID=150177 RepID=A0A5M3WWL7_9ACTN|nr:hypothetical protein [Acrocarpospora macrocephala]GES12339.1 hypothetical protein Amac_059360 [Acrocarpospora macrocephala]